MTKIADLNITTAKIAANAITAAKIETQQAWQTPTLTNGWVNYGSGYNTAAYMKDSLGFVHLKGLIKSGTMTATAFTLPAGYRPIATYDIVVLSNGTVGGVEITTAGLVVPAAGSNVYFSIDNISFKAEA